MICYKNLAALKVSVMEREKFNFTRGISIYELKKYLNCVNSAWDFVFNKRKGNLTVI